MNVSISVIFRVFTPVRKVNSDGGKCIAVGQYVICPRMIFLEFTFVSGNLTYQKYTIVKVLDFQINNMD